MEPQPPVQLEIADAPEFITALKQRHPEAWQQLCESYGQPLFLYAYHRCGDSHAAEDIRQETLLAAVRSIEHYRGDVPLFGWLCGIARHKSADWFRGQIPQDWPDENGDEFGYAKATGPDWDIIDLASLPQELVESSETRATVVQALWSLPAEHRQALLGRYVRGEAVEAIARRLQRSYKATESLLSRARQALRTRLLEITRNDT